MASRLTSSATLCLDARIVTTALPGNQTPREDVSTVTQSPAEPFDFDRVVHESQAHIRAYIAGLGVPRHDVDDVAQDVFVELYRFSGNIPENIPPKQWLKGIARNLCMNYFRRTSRRQRLQRQALLEIFLRAEQSDSPALS